MKKSSLRLPHTLLLFLAAGCALPLTAQEAGPMPPAPPANSAAAAAHQSCDAETRGTCWWRGRFGNDRRSRTQLLVLARLLWTGGGCSRMARPLVGRPGGPEVTRGYADGGTNCGCENYGSGRDAHSAGAAQCHIHSQRAAGRPGLFRDSVSGDD